VLSPDRAVGGVVVFWPEGTKTVPVDVIFPAVHGQNCEDGALQGLLELSGIPYVGSGVCASAIGFNKAFTHIVAEKYGVPMARWLSVHSSEAFDGVQHRVADTLGYPVFGKPANSGSSVGCSPAKNESELKKALDNAFLHDETALVEELVHAQEVECAVLGNLELCAPLVGEIRAVGGFYDYESKYQNDTAELLIPARISNEAVEQVRRYAMTVYRALGCRGLSRVDFFARPDGRVLLNEINTLPGFTSISMYPKLLIAHGYSYSGLIDALLSLAAERRRK
jgi:D-alanine--D-alanine ligase